VPEHWHIQPADSARSTRHRTELAALFADEVRQLLFGLGAVEFRWKWTCSDAREIGFDDADDLALTDDSRTNAGAD